MNAVRADGTGARYSVTITEVSDQDLLRGLERATWRVGATTNDTDLFAIILEAAADIERLGSSINKTFDQLPVRELAGASRKAWRRT